VNSSLSPLSAASDSACGSGSREPLAQGFDALTIDAEVAAPDARCRAHLDHLVGRVEPEFDIVDEVQKSAGVLHIEIVGSAVDQGRPRLARQQRFELGDGGWPVTAQP
jgi:hypothetical protein